jgi:hypothetical protein
LILLASVYPNPDIRGIKAERELYYFLYSSYSGFLDDKYCLEDIEPEELNKPLVADKYNSLPVVGIFKNSLGSVAVLIPSKGVYGKKTNGNWEPNFFISPRESGPTAFLGIPDSTETVSVLTDFMKSNLVTDDAMMTDLRTLIDYYNESC